jgi:hypothetical protein
LSRLFRDIARPPRRPHRGWLMIAEIADEIVTTPDYCTITSNMLTIS